MAGKISWTLELNGLDSAIVKLREIDRLLASITNRNGSMFFGGAAGGGTTSAGTTSRNATVSSPLPTAAVTSLAISSGLSRNAIANTSTTITSTSAGGGGISRIPLTAGPMVPALMNAAGTQMAVKAPFDRTFTAIGPPATIQSVMRHALGNGGIFGPGSPANSQIPPGILSKIPGSFPPIIPPPIIPGGGSGGGHAGGGGGSIFGVIGQFKYGLTTIIGVVYALHRAFKLLEEAIQHGAQAFRQGARTGRGVDTTFAIASALKQIGISEEATNLMFAQGQFNPKSRRFELPDSDVIVGAARASQFGNIQQLTNMAEEFKSALEEAKINAEQMGNAAKATEILSEDMTSITREWHTLLTQLAAQMYPIFHAVFEVVRDMLALANLIQEVILRIKQLLGIVPTGAPGSELVSGMGNNHAVVTPWEKIGFVFGGQAGPQEKLNEISKYTEKSSRLLEVIRGLMILKGPAHMIIPSLP